MFRLYPVLSLWLISAQLLSAQARPRLVFNKTFEQWAQDLESTDPAVRSKALSGLAYFSNRAKEVRPILHRTISTDKAEVVRRSGLYALLRIGPDATSLPALQKSIADPDQGVRSITCVALGKMAKWAPEVVPLLLHRLKNDPHHYVRSAAAEHLSKMATEAEQIIPGLLGAIADANKTVRLRAVMSLGLLGEHLKAPHINRLIPLFEQSEDMQNGYALARALHRTGKTALPLLEKALKSKSLPMQQGAVLTFHQYGTEAKAYAPKLKPLLKHPDAVMRIVTGRSLWQVSDRSEGALLAIVREIENPDPLIQRMAADTLRAQVPGALVLIAQWLKHKNPKRRRLAADSLAHFIEVRHVDTAHALFKLIEDKNESVREQAIRSMGFVGTPLVRDLLVLLKDRDPRLRRRAARALGNMRTNQRRAAIDELRESLEDKDPLVRLHAAHAVAMATQKPEEVLPLLIPALKSKDAKQRRAGVTVFMAFRNLIQSEAKPLTKTLRKLLAEALTDKDAIVRGIAAIAHFPVTTYQVSWSGKMDRVLPALAGGLQVSNPVIRMEIAKALSQWYNGNPAIAPDLLKALKDKDPLMRARIATAIWRAPPKANGTISALIELLQDNSPFIRQMAVMALGSYGPSAHSAVGPLTKTLKDPHITVRFLAAEALGKLGPKAATSVPGLLQLLKERKTAGELLGTIRATGYLGPSEPVLPSIRTFDQGLPLVMEALGEIGPAAKATVPLLEKEMSSADPGIRTLAIWALSQMGSSGCKALLKGLQSTEQQIQAECAQALSSVSSLLPQQIEALHQILKKSHGNLRQQLLLALIRQGAKAKATLPTLLQMADPRQEDSEARCMALRAIGEIAPEADRSRLILLQALRDADPLARQWGAIGLGRIGKSASEAIPELKRLRKDPDPFARRAAERALTQIQHGK